MSVLRSDIVGELIADVQLALADFFQAGDHSQRSRFTTAGGPNQNNKLLVGNFEVKICNSGNAAIIDLIDVFKCHTCHNNPPEKLGLKAVMESGLFLFLYHNRFVRLITRCFLSKFSGPSLGKSDKIQKNSVIFSKNNKR